MGESSVVQIPSSSSDGESQVDVIIVGAGVVGSALAYGLGVQGRRVLLLEKSLKEPDRIVGELLQPGGVQRLRELGLEGCLQGIDSPDVHGYAIFADGQEAQVYYPKDKNGSLHKGSSFHHGKFIMALRNAANSLAPRVELRECAVRSLTEENGKVVGVEYKQNDAINRVRAPLTIVCDGCNSDLRGKFVPFKPPHTSRFFGVIIKDTPLPYPNFGHVFLTTGGPVLAYQIGTRDTRLLVDIIDTKASPAPTGDELKEYLRTVTAAQLPQRMQEPFREALKDRIQSMRNSHLSPHDGLGPGVLFLGDSINMRHPLTGGGMTVGLSDATVTRNLLATVKDLTDTDEVTSQLKQLYKLRKGYSSTINILSWALYDVFTATKDPMLPAMRRACMAYLKAPFFAAGPVALLSGLRPQPLYLMMHFFAVAIFGVLRTLRPFPTPGRIVKAFRLLSAASRIVVPLVKSEKVLPLLPILCRFMLLTGPNKPIQP